MALHIGGSLLIRRLQEANKTQEELAEYLGMYQSFISRVANNKKKLSYEQAAHTAYFLKCNMEDLYDRIVDEDD